MNAALVGSVEALIQKTIDEVQAGWMPRLEEALIERDALRNELSEERARHARFVEMADSRARADRHSMERMRTTMIELEDQLAAQRVKA